MHCAPKGLVPTICFSATVPQILKVYRTIAERLTDFEDHSSTRGHADALTRKTFALNSIVAYTGLAMSAFVYIPFGETIMKGIDSKVYKHAADSQVAEKATREIDEARMKKRAINKGRLQDQVRFQILSPAQTNNGLKCLPSRFSEDVCLHRD